MIGRLLADRYRITELLSSNTVGKTYLASDTYRPGYPQCIVKQLQPLSDSPKTPRLVGLLLKKRIEVLKELGKSDYAPKILDFFEDARAVYLVEEWIAGQALSQELQPDRTLPEGYVIRLLQVTLESLVFIHRHGVIHQDIQPDNLFRRQSDSKLLLINFRLIREVNVPEVDAARRSTPAGEVEAISYKPPEQLQGNPQPNSDLYALGVIAIQALTGLTVEAIAALQQQNSSATDDIPWQQQVQVRRRLADVVDRMVRQDYRRRYHSAAHALHDLYRVARELGAPISLATPPPTKALTDDRSQSQPSPAPSPPPAPPPGPVESPLSPTQPPAERTEIRTGAASEDDIASSIAPTQLQRSPARRPLLLKGAVAVLVLGGLVALAQQLSTGQLAQSFAGRGTGKNQSQTGSESPTSASQSPESSAEIAARFNHGVEQLRAGNQQQALDDFSYVIQQNPNHAEAHAKRGNVRYQLGDRQGAFEDYSRALQLDSNLIQAYVNRGSVWSDLGNEQAAIEDYTQAIQRDPNLAAAYLNRCLSRSNVDDQSGAIEDCTRAISLKPSYAFAYQNRGLAYRRQGNTRRAIEDFNVAIRLTPQDADPYYNRGVARAEIGDYQGAVQDFDVTIRLNPQHSFVYYDRGLAWAKLGDSQKAIQDLERSAKLCLDQGRTDCYKDAQYQLQQLRQGLQ